LIGDFTREEGLAALLAGTGLEWAPAPGGTYTVRPPPARKRHRKRLCRPVSSPSSSTP
jgi:hypothetical protein